MKTFNITDENRRNLIIAIVFQILNQIYIGLEFLYIDSSSAPDQVQQLLINIAYLIAYLFTVKTIYAYFKAMDLVKIAKNYYLIAILETVILVVNSVILFAPELDISTGIISLIGFVFWIRFGILLYQEKGPDLEKSYERIRQYGISNLIIIIPGLIHMMFLAFNYAYLGLESTVYLYMLIPLAYQLLFSFEIGKHSDYQEEEGILDS